MKSVRGKVHYQQLGPGFWGIVGANGQNYRPVNMPNQLKHEGKTVLVKVVPAGDVVSIYMWGEAVRIVAFETLKP